MEWMQSSGFMAFFAGHEKMVNIQQKKHMF